jgi:hypothetical protein
VPPQRKIRDKLAMWFAPFGFGARSTGVAAAEGPERDSDGAPTPPWVRYPAIDSGDFFWREAGQPWLVQVWEPFVHNLSPERLAEYLAKYPPPEDWRQMYFDPETRDFWDSVDSDASEK